MLAGHVGGLDQARVEVDGCGGQPRIEFVRQRGRLPVREGFDRADDLHIDRSQCRACVAIAAFKMSGRWLAVSLRQGLCAGNIDFGQRRLVTPVGDDGQPAEMLRGRLIGVGCGQRRLDPAATVAHG